MRARLQWILCACVGLAWPAFADTDFLSAARAFNEKHEPEFKEIEQVALNDDVKTANHQLVAIAQKEHNAAGNFIVGNMLFHLDPAASYSLHKMAYEAEPREKLTTLEWAMERHRQGEYTEALSLYQAYLGLEPDDEKTEALLADCLVRNGKLPDAVKAWQAAKHETNHTEIDFAIFEIYGGSSPMSRRMELLDQINAGDHSKLEKLIFLDLNFDDDWWNKSVNVRALKTDLTLAKKILTTDTDRFAELSCYAQLVTADQPADDIKSNLVAGALLIGDSGQLPKSSLVAQELAELVVGKKIETAAQLLQRHQAALEGRAKSTDGDADALNLLCFLCEASKDARLAEFDKYGWDRYGEARFAASYLIGQSAAKNFTADDAGLQRALKQFPENSLLAELQLRAAGQDKLTTVMVASAIKAEYRKLSFGMGMPDSYTLKGLFNVLRERLNKTKPANS
jgi:tetratricopeptide (TPR) repeat protein